MHRSLFGVSHHPYLIYAPDYTPISGGVRVMHLLCHALNELGYRAILACDKTHPQLNTPHCSVSAMPELCRELQKHGFKPIAVYPEIVHGNPFNALCVVRYLLNRPGHIGGPIEFDATDILYAYDDYFVSPGMSAKILTIPTIDPLIYHNNQPQTERRKVCFYARKYRIFKNKLPPSFHDGHIDLSYPERPWSVIARILQDSRLLYCYEPSGITLEAVLCGCPVAYVLSDYMDAQPAKVFFGENGACTVPVNTQPTPDDWTHMHRTLGLCTTQYRSMLNKIWGDLDCFARETQAVAASL